MQMQKRDDLLVRVDHALRRMEALHLEEYVCYAGSLRRRLVSELLSGIVRGIGFSIGFTLLGAVIVILLRDTAIANLPVIGQFVAEIVRIVEKNL